MSDIKTEGIMTDNGDDDQWLYGDSNSNLDPVIATSVEEVKPVIEPTGIPEDEVILL